MFLRSFNLKTLTVISILVVRLPKTEGLSKNSSEEFSKILGQRLREQRQDFSLGNSSLTPKAGIDLINEAELFQSTKQAASPRSWEDDVGFWNVTTNGTRKRTCILFQAAIQFDISYSQTDGKRYIARIDLPSSSADATGDCEERSQFINLTWPIPLSNNTIAYGSVWIFFVNYYQSVPVTTKAPPANTFAVSHIRITYPAANLPNASNPDEMLLVENKSLDNFSTPVENSYRCEYQELKSAEFTIRFADLQFQAFMRSIPSDIVKFYKPIFCRPSSEDPAAVSKKDIFIGLAVAGALLCIFGFIYWHRRNGEEDDDDDYED